MTSYDFSLPIEEAMAEWPDWMHEFYQNFSDIFVDEIWREGKDRIEYINNLAKKARYGYIVEGMVLRKFKIRKTYKDLGYKTFKQYCEVETGKPVWRCNQTIQAAVVAWDLICNGFKEVPNCVAQALMLLNCAVKNKDNKDVNECWDDCLDTSKASKTPVTAHFIKKVIMGESVEDKKRLNIPVSVYNKLKKMASRMGLSVEAYLEQLVDKEETAPPPTPSPEEETDSDETTNQEHNTTENDLRTITPILADSREWWNGGSTEILVSCRESGVSRPEPPY